MNIEEIDRAIIQEIQNGGDRIDIAWRYKVTVPHVNRILRQIGIKPTGMEFRRAHLDKFMKEFNKIHGTNYKAKI